jgi:hypothetical protein
VVERSIEHSHVRHGGKEPPHLANPSDNHRIMQRRERIKFFHLREELVTEKRALCEFFATMNNAMRNETHFSCAPDDSGFL